MALPVLKRKPGVRETGFDLPLHPLQIVSYVVFGYDFLTYYLVNMTSLSANLLLVSALGVVYLAISIVVVVYAVRATRSDPSDPTIRKQLMCEAMG